MFFPNPEQNIRQRQDGSDDGRLPAVRILAVLRELGNHVSRDNLNKPATKTARQSPVGLAAVVDLLSPEPVRRLAFGDDDNGKSTSFRREIQVDERGG